LLEVAYLQYFLLPIIVEDIRMPEQCFRLQKLMNWFQK